MFKWISKAHLLSFEIGGAIGLGCLLAFLIGMSWRKWPDPLIDFGIQLYTPWRLVHGAVLYRDIDYLYGPLSQYFNATLFACFGTSLMVLVTANLLVFIAILASTYFLCRSAWGVGPAFAAVVIFIAVFGFSQFVTTGNHNYAAPYSHETTHGLLVCLLLAIMLVRWVENATFGVSLCAGILFGLTFVLKPEIALAGGLSILVAWLAKYLYGNLPSACAMAIMALGTIFPTIAFVIYFAFFMPWTEAVRAACHGWLIVITTTRFTGNIQELSFLGFDQIGKHFEQHALAAFLACLFTGLLAAVAWQVERIGRKWWYYLNIVLLAGLASWLAICKINWIESGRCLTGLALIYLGTCLVSLSKDRNLENNRRVRVTRLLMAVLATAFLARMILNARIYQLGYYQAVLAAIMVPAVLIGELPQWIGVGKRGAFVITIGTLSLFAPGVVILCGKSQQILSFKTLLVGTGEDRFYAFSPRIDPMGEIVDTVNDVLRESRSDQTLLVLPEGLMINYLARLPSPNAPCCYFSMAASPGREDQTVKELEHHPPDFVVIISRDLRGFGVQRYGEKPNEGQQILSWVGKNYEAVSTVGGDPLDYRQRGALILRRKHNFP